MTHNEIEERTLAEPASVTADVVESPDPPAVTGRWARQAVVGDLVVAALAAALAGVLRFGWEAPLHPTVAYAVLAGLVVGGWPLVLAFCGAYELRTSLFGVEELRRVLRAALYVTLILGMTHFLFKLDLSRAYVALLIPILAFLTSVWRVYLRRRITADLAEGRGRYRAVAMGPAEDLCRLVQQLATARRRAIEIVAVVVDDLDEGDPRPTALDGYRVLPTRDHLRQVVAGAHTPIDLLLRAGNPPAPEMWALTRRAHDLGLTLAIAPHHLQSHNVNLSYTPLGTTPLLVVERPAFRAPQAASKAIFDRVAGLLLLVALSPLLLVLAALIALRDGRPVLFVQERAGKDGRPFRCVKFRTMVPDAEARLAELEDQNEADGLLFKVRADPRVTKVGAFLRRTSMDELPQLINVVRGEMSLVGPRPWPVAGEDISGYDERTARRLHVKPGITGLWQVSGRSDLPWDDAIYLDLLYIDHWSPLLDAVILLRTVTTVLRPRGAY